MKIEIKNIEELPILFKALAEEIVKARNYFHLFDDLIGCFPSYEQEFHQSDTFWNLTVDAIREAGFICLCRVYDQSATTLNLANLLDTIKANLEQLKCVPDKHEIDQDIESARRPNPVVKNLMLWRDNTAAHRGAKIILGKNQVLVDNPVSPSDIQELLELALSILNKYSGVCQTSTWSVSLTGHDDYKNLLNLVRLGIEKWDQESKYQAEPTARRRAEEENEGMKRY